MASEYCRGVLRIAVAQICQNLGWNSTQSTPLELLTDVMERYLLELGNVSHRYCEQFGRTEVNLDDVGLAFQQLSVSLDELTEYISHVEPIPFAKENVAFPAPKQNNLQFPNPRSREILQHREEHIPEYLPHMFPGGKDDVDEPLQSDVVGLVPEYSSQAETSPIPADSKVTVSSTEGPPSKRPRISNAALPAEADPSQYEMMSVTMTHEGELTPKRQGKLPDNRTPPAGFRQSLFHDPQPSPSELLKERSKEKYSESEREKSDVDVIDVSDNNKSNNNSSILIEKDSKKLDKKFKSKMKVHNKDIPKKKNPPGRPRLSDIADKKKKKLAKEGKLIEKKKMNKESKPKETKIEGDNEELITASIQNLRDPEEESNSLGNSPERLVIASEADVRDREKNARMAAVDDCIDAVIRQSAAEELPIVKTEPEVQEVFIKPKKEVLDSFDETINSVVRQSSEDNDTTFPVEVKVEYESDQQNTLMTKSLETGEEKVKKKRKLKDGKPKPGNKDKGVKDKLKKKLISKSLSTIAKKTVIPALPEKYLTDEMKVFAFDDSPEHPGLVEKEEVIQTVIEEAGPLDLSLPSIKSEEIPVPESKVKEAKPMEQLNKVALPKAPTPPPVVTSLKINVKEEEKSVPKIKTEGQASNEGNGEKKVKEKHKSKDHKKDKKDKKDREKNRDKEKKKKKKKDKDKDRDREKTGEKGDKEKSKEKKKEKSKSEKSEKPEKKPKDKESRSASPSTPLTPTFPRVTLNIKLGGTPISSTSVVSSPARSASDGSILGSPKVNNITDMAVGSPSRPEIPKLVIKPLSKQGDDQKAKEKEEKQKVKKEEKQKLKEEKRLKEEKELERQKEIEREKEKEREREKELKKAKEKELELERRKKEEQEKDKERQRQKELALKQKELELKKKEEEQRKAAEKKRQEEELKEKQRKMQKEREKLAHEAKISKAAKKLLKKQLLEPLPPKEIVKNRSRSPTPPTVPASPASSTHSSPSHSPVRTPRAPSPSASPKIPPKPSPTSPAKTPGRGRGRPPKNKNSPKVNKPSPRRFSPRTKSPESPNRSGKSGSPGSDIVLDSSSGVVAETVGTFVDAAGNQIWICPACKMQDDGSPMIGCDGCPDWYHWVCVNIVQEPPEDEEWFCPRCRQNKKLKPKLKKKRKKKV